MTSFRKRDVPLDRVAEVESAASTAPIVGDPRLKAVLERAPTFAKSEVPPKLGSSQDVLQRYEIGVVYEILIGIIKSNPVPPRAIYTAAAVDDMAIKLERDGQRVSATGFINNDGLVVLKDGETRLRGARAAGLPTLRVEINAPPASDQELYEEARAANVDRREQTPLDDALRWRYMLDNGIYPTQGALAKALRLREDHVSRTLSLAKMPMMLIHAAAESPDLLTHKMLNAIREYWEVNGDEPTIDLIREAAKTGMGYRDVVAKRKTSAKGPIKRPRASREVVQFRGAKGELKSFDGGRLELSLAGLDADASEELTRLLIEFFAKPPVASA